MRYLILCLFICFVLFFGIDCTSVEQCVPGATQVCPCLSGSRQVLGVQSCADDGLRWGSCDCPSPRVDAGAPKEPKKVEPVHEVSIPDSQINPEPFDKDRDHREFSSPDSFTPDSFTPDSFTSDGGERPSEQGLDAVPPETVPDLAPFQRLKLDLWPWEASAAISLTIDDGLRSPFEKLVPEIEKRGWQATLFICSEFATREKTWPLIKQAYLKGHEVTSHTHTHRNMAKLTEKELHEEFQKSIQELQKNVDWKLPLLSFAYPYESMGALAEKIVWDYHRYARGGDQGVDVPPNPVPLNDARQPNFKFLQAKAPTRKFTVTQWNTWVAAAVKQKKWFIEEYHGVDGKDWEPRTMAEFKAHFDYIESFGRKVWVAPVSKVGNYIDERQTAKFTILKWTQQEILLQLQDRFTPKHNVPLTFTIQIPASWGWKAIKVTQNGATLRYEVIRSGWFRTEGLPEPTLSIRITPR